MHPKIYIYTDGASRGNPGKAAVAVLIFDENKRLIEKYSECIGKTTNNVAEYTAIIKALELAEKYIKEINIFSDSELVVRQLNGKYKVKAKHLKPLFERVKEIEKSFEKVKYHNLSRENKYISQADELVNEELDKK